MLEEGSTKVNHQGPNQGAHNNKNKNKREAGRSRELQKREAGTSSSPFSKLLDSFGVNELLSKIGLPIQGTVPNINHGVSYHH